MVQKPLPKLPPLAMKILSLLDRQGTATSVDLSAVSLRYANPIYKLRRAGFLISSIRIKGSNICKYRLEGRP